MRNSELAAACVAVAVYAVLIGAMLNVGGGFQFWGASAVDWVDAIGSAGAAMAAVWLGVRAVNRERRDESGRARLVAFLVLPEVEIARDRLRSLIADTEGELFDRTFQVVNRESFFELAQRFSTARFIASKAHAYELAHLPGGLGYRIAALATFFDEIATTIESCLDYERKSRLADLSRTFGLARAKLPEVDALAAALRALSQGDQAAAERRVEAAEHAAFVAAKVDPRDEKIEIFEQEGNIHGQWWRAEYLKAADGKFWVLAVSGTTGSGDHVGPVPFPEHGFSTLNEAEAKAMRLLAEMYGFYIPELRE